MNEVAGINMNTASGSASVSSMGNSQSKPAPVLQAYGELGAGIAHLGEVIAQLRVKLEPILGPDVPMAGETGVKTDDAASPLTSSIRSDAGQVRDLTLRIDNLIRRVEV